MKYWFKINFTMLSAICLFLSNSNLNSQQLFINEFQASNLTTIPENLDYDDFSDWIELYNSGPEELNLAGYAITDDLNNPAKYVFSSDITIDANSCKLLWADGFDETISNIHLSFKLSRAGEIIALFDPRGNLLDSITYGQQFVDISYGRKSDGDSSWVYFSDPTPGRSNSSVGTSSTEFTEAPFVSLESGVYGIAQTVNISSNEPNGIIRYTLDGSKPNYQSREYRETITINSNTTLKARTFVEDKLASHETTKNYIIKKADDIAMLALSVYPSNFFGETGIYTNQLKFREMPVDVTFIEPGGETGFEVRGGIRLSGQASFLYPRKPMTIRASGKFGQDGINYQIFKNRDYTNYISFYLRNSGTPDNRRTLFRDAFQHSLVINKMDIDCQAYQPVNTYINGEYWGIYNLREKQDADYLAARHNADPNNLDIIEFDFGYEPLIDEGDAVEFENFFSFFQNNDMRDDRIYRQAETKLDIEAFINYSITQIYCNNVNWPDANIKWWRERTEEAKWRCLLLDMDWGFGTIAGGFTSHYDENTLLRLQDNRFYRFSAILYNLLRNENFEADFVQRFSMYMDNIFSKERVTNILDSLQNKLEPYMDDHIERWIDSGIDPVMGDPPIQSIPYWKNLINVMRNFGDNRPTYMKQHLQSFFNLTERAVLNLTVAEKSTGRLRAAGIDVGEASNNNFYIDKKINIEAIPAVGYRFVKWEGVIESTEPAISLQLNEDSNLTAVFEPGDDSILPSIVNSDMTLTLSDSPFLVRENVEVSENVTLTIEPGVEIILPQAGSILVKGVLKANGTFEEPIVLKPNFATSANNWGAICFDSGSSKSSLNHIKLIGASNGSDKEKYKGAISAFETDLDMDHISILDAPFPIFTQYGNITLTNSELHSERTCDFINIKYAETALVENCEFRGNHAFDTDAIDYDQIKNGVIRGNRIYNFYGFNSDGIDLGEGSKNILIENNWIFNCSDKGISVGQASTGILKNNVIVNCTQGVGVKDDSATVYIDGNTFYGCDYAVASFEKNIGAGGGTAYVNNSIFAKSEISPIFVDNLSILEVKYSLADNMNIPGDGNIHADPQFYNDFRLRNNSPAVDAGDPNSPSDPDGSPKDIGAYSYEENTTSVLISEIDYNPRKGSEYRFIELYNSGESEADLSGFSFKNGIEFVFPENSIIQSKEYFIVCSDTSKFKQPELKKFQWFNSSINSLPQDIELHDRNGRVIDFVSYDKTDGWDEGADGTGYTLNLRDSRLENLYTYNWNLSSVLGGTPGRTFSKSFTDKIIINELQAANINTIADESGEYEDWIEILNLSDEAIDIGGLFLTDDLENLTKFAIPTNNSEYTTIAPKNYRLLWADEETDEGTMHLGFKLSKSEELALSEIIEGDTTIISSVKFTELKDGESYGRINDGSDIWKVFERPNPLMPNSVENLFEKGILLVNAQLLTNNTDAKNAYAYKTYCGNTEISFWDIYDSPANGYPDELPEVLGHGVIPFDTLKQYTTVIWVGGRSQNELTFWQQTDIGKYIIYGGNLVLLSSQGQSYIPDEIARDLGIIWSYDTQLPLITIEAVNDKLIDMDNIKSQVFCSVFDLDVFSDQTEVLFKEQTNYADGVGTGLISRISGSGVYREVGGNVVFIAGRPERYNQDKLKTNMLTILSEFLGEDIITGINEDENNEIVISQYKLSQNYPNPFNPTTKIQYDILFEGQVELSIYNILGQKVKTLVNQTQKSGRYNLEWNGTDNHGGKVSSGIYIYQIKSNGWRDTKKMMLLK